MIARALYRFDPFMSPNPLAPMWQQLANWTAESATAKFYEKKKHYIDARYQKVRRQVFQKFASNELIKLSNPDSGKLELAYKRSDTKSAKRSFASDIKIKDFFTRSFASRL